MKLSEFKFHYRGDLLEAAEILGIQPEEEVPENCRKIALMLSCLEEFASNVKWRDIIKANLNTLKSVNLDFVTLMHTEKDPVILIPGLPVLTCDGSLVKSDVAVFESRTLHLNNIYRHFYHGKFIKTDDSEKTGTFHDNATADTH